MLLVELLAELTSGREPTFLLRPAARKLAGPNEVPSVPLEKIREIAERVAASEGLEVLEVEFRGGRNGLLRIFIDKPAGITHQDCEVVSRQVGAILDVEDLVPFRYTLEVSSPGAERRLTRPADLERFAGKLVKVVLKEPLAGQDRWKGRITSFQAGVLTLEVDGAPVAVPWEKVERANLVLEW